jgi:hypothetical protein
VNGTQSPTVGISDGSVRFPTGLQIEDYYWVGMFENDSYNILITDSFQVLDGQPMVSIDKEVYDVGESITASFINGPNNPTDWIGIYKAGDIPGAIPSTLWFYVNGTQSPTVGISDGSVIFAEGLSDQGTYWAGFFENDGYTMLDSTGFVVSNLSDSVAPLAPANVMVTAGSFVNLVIWEDVPGETGEKYNVYASMSPITNLSSPNVDLIASDILGGVQAVDHNLLSPLTNQNVTYYYSVVCKDFAGNIGDPGLSGSTTNLAKGVAVVSEVVPAFVADGDLSEWQGIRHFRMNPEDGTGHIHTNTIIDDSTDLNAKAWVAIDANYLYVAFDVDDNIFTPVDPTLISWQLDSPDLFIGLYDYHGVPHSTYQRGSKPDYHIRFNELLARNDHSSSEYDSLLVEGENYFFGEKLFPVPGYVVEAKISLDVLATGRDVPGTNPDTIHVEHGYRVPIDFAINDNDNSAGRQGLMFYSVTNNDEGWNNPSKLSYTWIGDWVLGADDEEMPVNGYSLFQNYPNPFNPSTQIKFALKEAGFVTLKVYDILGKEVATLIKGDYATGSYKVSFDASGLASGIYFYRLETGSFVQTNKMMLLK